jgi:hypothetical protein
MNAIEEITAERKRQIEVEGWDLGRDDLYVDAEMAVAAAAYAVAGTFGERRVLPSAAALWPWSMAWWKPTSRRRNLIKAAALIVAEIERLDRRAALEAALGGK